MISSDLGIPYSPCWRNAAIAAGCQPEPGWDYRLIFFRPPNTNNCLAGSQSIVQPWRAAYAACRAGISASTTATVVSWERTPPPPSSTSSSLSPSRT